MKRKTKLVIAVAVVVLLFLSLLPVRKILLPKRVSLIYGYLDDHNTLIRSSQALGDVLFRNPEKVTYITHEGNAEFMIFTRESGFSAGNGKTIQLDGETLVQVYLVNDCAEEISDTLHVCESDGNRYDVKITSQSGTLIIENG